jgi:hypothetical protein
LQRETVGRYENLISEFAGLLGVSFFLLSLWPWEYSVVVGFVSMGKIVAPASP